MHSRHLGRLRQLGRGPRIHTHNIIRHPLARRNKVAAVCRSGGSGALSTAKGMEGKMCWSSAFEIREGVNLGGFMEAVVLARQHHSSGRCWICQGFLNVGFSYASSIPHASILNRKGIHAIEITLVGSICFRCLLIYCWNESVQCEWELVKIWKEKKWEWDLLVVLVRNLWI